jgi:hypothetical protein
MLGLVEAQLPEHRERKFPPTGTLAMFLGQIMSADGSCQNAVNEAIVACLLAGMNPGSVSTSGYCQARQRLPQEMVGMLARQSGALLGEQPPTSVGLATYSLSLGPAFFYPLHQLLIPYVSAIRGSPGNMFP